MDFMITINALFEAYDGLMRFVLVYGIIVVFLLFKGTKEEKRIFVYPAIVLGLTIYNPLFIAPVSDIIGLTPRIRRIFWLLPVTLLLAYSAVKVFSLIKQRWLKAIFLCAVLILVAYFGKSMFTSFVKTQNAYHIDEDIISIDEALCEDGGSGKKQAAYADLRLLELRQYDASVKNTLSRKMLISWEPEESDSVKELFEKKSYDKIITMVLKCSRFDVDNSAFVHSLALTDTKYVITCDEAVAVYLEKCGLTCIDKTQTYYLYKMPDDEKNMHVGSGVTLYFVRHSQTVANKEGRLMGRDFNSDLTEEAADLAFKLGERLSDIHFDAVYTSKSKRTQETAGCIMSGAGNLSPVYSDIRLNDIYWGSIEGMTRKEVNKEYGVEVNPDDIFGAADDMDYQNPYGGENQYEFIKRFGEGIDEIAQNPDYAGGHVLVVIHSSMSMWAKEVFKCDEYDGIYHECVSGILYKDGEYNVLFWNNPME